MKRIGIICQDVASGIGNQTREMARFLEPEKVLITDLTMFHEAAGKKVKRYSSWFEGFNSRVSNGIPTEDDCRWLLEGIDVLLVVETALNHEIYNWARELGVKSYLIYNYELVDKLHSAYRGYPMADVLWAPSMWHYEDMEFKAKEWGCDIKYVPVPVNRQVLPFKPRQKARTFLFVAGHPTHRDRNGKDIVTKAISLTKSQDIRFIIRTQHDIDDIDDPRVRVLRKEVRDYWEMFTDDIDVLLLPRRYGGLSLQKTEALSRGIPTIMTDISPNSIDLPKEWLVPAHFQERIVTRPEIDIYECTPEDLAAKIDYVASLSEFTFTNWSYKADRIAQGLDWRVMKPIYEALLQGEEAPEPKVPEEALFWT